jgi:hypothetical protein
VNKFRAGLAVVLLLCAIEGSLSPFHESPPRIAGDYRVLKADFHVHMFPGDGSYLSPCDMALDAKRRHLDVVALTPHNLVWTAKLGAWCAKQFGGPLVLVGQEVVTPLFHMLAVGIEAPIDWRNSPRDVIAAIHAQGGVAIAAHPSRYTWSGYDTQALSSLDASEVWRGDCVIQMQSCEEYRAFAKLGHFAAVGDSDLHNAAPLGIFYTYVFVREISQQGVLDALRAQRTVVYDGQNFFGNPELIPLVKSFGDGQPGDSANIESISGRVASLVLLGLLLLGWKRKLTNT